MKKSVDWSTKLARSGSWERAAGGARDKVNGVGARDGDGELKGGGEKEETRNLFRRWGRCGEVVVPPRRWPGGGGGGSVGICVAVSVQYPRREWPAPMCSVLPWWLGSAVSSVSRSLAAQYGSLEEPPQRAQRLTGRGLPIAMGPRLPRRWKTVSRAHHRRYHYLSKSGGWAAFSNPHELDNALGRDASEMPTAGAHLGSVPSIGVPRPRTPRHHFSGLSSGRCKRPPYAAPDSLPCERGVYLDAYSYSRGDTGLELARSSRWASVWGLDLDGMKQAADAAGARRRACLCKRGMTLARWHRNRASASAPEAPPYLVAQSPWVR